MRDDKHIRQRGAASARDNDAALQESHAPSRGGEESSARSRERDADDGDRPVRPRKPWYRRPVFASILIVVILAVVVGGTLLWRHSRTYESTDDAFIDIVAQRV